MVQLFFIVSKHRGVDFHHPHSEKIGHPEGIDVYLALFIKTNAIFYINDIFHQVRPNSIVIFSPGTSFSYHNPEGDCINDYFRFHCSDPDLKKTVDLFLNLLCVALKL